MADGLAVKLAVLDADETFEAAVMEARPEGLTITLRDWDEGAGQVRAASTFTWDRLTAERIARAILAELAATRR